MSTEKEGNWRSFFLKMCLLEHSFSYRHVLHLNPVTRVSQTKAALKIKIQQIICKESGKFYLTPANIGVGTGDLSDNITGCLVHFFTLPRNSPCNYLCTNNTSTTRQHVLMEYPEHSTKSKACLTQHNMGSLSS